MRSYILFSVVCLQLGWTYGVPAVKGVGAYSYQDSAGNSITGQRIITSESAVERFAPLPLKPLGGFKPFKPLQPLRPFPNIHRVKRFLPPLPPLPPLQPFQPLPPLQPLRPLFPRLRPFLPFQPFFQTKSRLHGYNFDGFNQYMMPFGAQNSAFAGAAAGPGFTHQIASLSPENPTDPNINIMNRFSDSPGPGKFYSVSSSSYASSANVNGREEGFRGAETLVNNNGQVTHYRVQN